MKKQKTLTETLKTMYIHLFFIFKIPPHGSFPLQFTIPKLVIDTHQRLLLFSDEVALMTCGMRTKICQFTNGAHGTAMIALQVLHISPEASLGGPRALHSLSHAKINTISYVENLKMEQIENCRASVQFSYQV